MTHPDETTTASGAATALLIELEAAAGVPEAQPLIEIRPIGRRRYIALVRGERLTLAGTTLIVEEFPTIELARMAAEEHLITTAPFTYDQLKAASDAGYLPAFLATLSRLPDRGERQAALEHLAAAGDRKKGYLDVVWALINTREFILNH